MSDDAAWLATSCAGLVAWLAEVDEDEDTLRAVVLSGGESADGLRRKALVVVDRSLESTRRLQDSLAAASQPASEALVAFSTELSRVLDQTAAVLEGVRPRIAVLPVEDPALFGREAAPVVSEVLVAEARLVRDLTAAVVAARRSDAGELFASTSQCDGLDEGLRLGPQ